MFGLGLDERRLLLFADGAQLAMATRVEYTAGRRVGRTGDLAFELDPLLGCAFDRRQCRQERLGVRVMWGCEDGLRFTDLHQPPEIQHGDSVGDVANHAKVVRDEEV